MFAWRVVGIPKRDPSESRPIAIASFLLRAWQKAILDALPNAPEGQWAEIGVIPAVADFMAWADGCPSAGGELDLAKAYDSVLHGPAAAALQFSGAPREVVAWLQEAWKAKRICNVNGELAAPILPSSGILPGDPTSGRVLSLLLRPWHSAMEAQDVKSAAYADDRSIKAAGADVKEAEAKVELALQDTALFDKAVGLKENAKKRQRWKGGETAEHLGLNLQLGGPEEGQEVKLPAPRDGWDSIEDGIKRLSMLPAGFEARAAVARGCILPKFRWAVPFIQQPPRVIADTLYRQLLRTGCTWWCVARVWADHVMTHPNFSVAIQALKVAGRLPASVVRNAAVRQHAACIGMVPKWGEGNEFRLEPCEGSDTRIVEAARAAVKSQGSNRSKRTDFDPACGAGEHAMRVAARVKALGLRPKNARVARGDCEGLTEADVEAMSHPKWKRWIKTLDEEEKTRLRVWRGGATSTPTRRFSCRRGQTSDDPRAACRWCSHPRASARHFWQECPRFNALRGELEVEHDVPKNWWRVQPSCTSKTGWITLSAAKEAAKRAEFQIAACRLGIAIARLSPPEGSEGSCGH